MQLSVEPAIEADAEALVQIQIAAFHHDSVLYPEVEPSGPPGYDSVEQVRRNIAQHSCYKLVSAGRPIGVMVIV